MGDVLVAGEPELAGTLQQGIVKLFSVSNMASPVIVTSSFGDNRARFGNALQALGDLDGDGRDELAVGSPGAHMDDGRVAVLHFSGFSEPTLPMRRTIAPATSGAAAHFGAYLPR